MKRCCSYLALFALVGIVSAPARAAGFSLFGSLHSLEDGDEGGGVGVRFAWLSTEHLDFDLSATIIFRSDVGLGPERLPDEVRLIPLDLGFRYHFAPDERFRPYLGAGGTFVRLESELGELDDEAGWYAVVGLNSGDRYNADFFIEAMYRFIDEGSVKRVPGEPESVQPTVDVSGLGVNLGVTWRW